ncbi:hypothetical protein SAMN05421504_103898 [Amycolatopsis xylanica]|uniref:DUF5666 domain-containing protein n=1 Tax=Amycolatopsis xylanica TaxID=589385 RepID=A0A1H3EN59_9PSEU|nr:hypothetical protein [Amycolatopsis xylanica]SDX80055.1 hypothetical protein SAMN05421504_103898 [Amycolatopsis xylanica]
MISNNRRVAGAVLGLVSAGLLLAGGQAIAAPASSAPAAPASSEQLVVALTGTVSATVNGGFKLALAGGGSIDVEVNSLTEVKVAIKAGIKVKAVGIKVDGKLVAGLVVSA